ncbi:Uncharacterised protein [Niallia circulans]|nr:Uncharacterised protein [Niallia circulans]
MDIVEVLDDERTPAFLRVADFTIISAYLSLSLLPGNP